MLAKSPENITGNLFWSPLRDMLDSADPLVALADRIDWSLFDEVFAVYYSKEGRPAKPIRLMVGLLLLKYLENLSDEVLVVQWKRNPYYQYFCGMREYVPALPCDSSELVRFRQRIGKEGTEKIFDLSVRLHGERAEEKEVIVDTTVQEKNVTYPTDGKMALKIIHRLHRIAKAEGVRLRRTYVKEIKEHRISLRNFRHPKRAKRARAAMKRLRTIAAVLMRELSRKMNEESIQKYREEFELYGKVLQQKRNDKNKIYSLHEPHIYAVSKGKEHKKYEYGTKASIVGTKTSGIIVGVTAHERYEHDSKTLEEAIDSAHRHRETRIEEAIADRGYRGRKSVKGVTISIPGTPKRSDSRYQREKVRRKFRRRAAIEPVIGHLKADHRLRRNYLKGFIGDEINLLLAAAAFNLKKWMNLFLLLRLLFAALLVVWFLYGLEQKERMRYTLLTPWLLRIFR